MYESYCGTCHLAAKPGDLPKALWANSVLPDMASRLGLSINGYDPYAGIPWQEKAMMASINPYPSTPLISEEDYTLIHTYILAHAPEELRIDDRSGRTLSLDQFSSEIITIDQRTGGHTTFLGYDESSSSFTIGNIAGYLLSLNASRLDTLGKTYSPITAWSGIGTSGVLADVGVMAPSEMREGKISQVSADLVTNIKVDLHRPVYVLEQDLNNDGVQEILICEYGYYSGQLTLLEQTREDKYDARSLLNVPGTTRVIAQDMNHDGLTDLVVVVGQGNEGVYILYQTEGLHFTPEQVLKQNPLAGTSWMELVDYDHDGDMDLVLAQGDNADLSYTLKPYHGVRIFLNDGADQFTEAFFYPIFGATRVLARDFDEDGDIDLAVNAYFPDFDALPEESFVYLENVDAALFQFQARTFPDATRGRWITSEAGDYDGDGDLDIMLGSFTHTPTPVPPAIMENWNTVGTDMILLRNHLR